MHLSRCCVPFALLVATALPGQDPSFGLTQDELISVTGNSGLQPALDGNGLCGAGPDYAAFFTDRGLRFEPALGHAVENVQHLTLTPTSVRRGTEAVLGLPSFAPVEQHGLVACYPHAPGVSERYDVRPHGVELSWHFAQPMRGDGDLVVRYAVDTSLPVPTAADGGLRFEIPDVGGVRIGGVTGIDARGARVTGGVRYVDGALELSLPATFVDRATYPLVLDPTIGTVFGLSSNAGDVEPDVAYDAASDRFLVVWGRSFSSASNYVRAQLVGSLGNLIGTTLSFSTAGRASPVRVANHATLGNFGVVWSRDEVIGTNTVGAVDFVALSASAGQITAVVTLASGGLFQFAHPDIGCETNGQHGFTTVYQDTYAGVIKRQRVLFSAIGVASAESPVTVLSDGGVQGYVYEQPALPRAAAADGKLLMVTRRTHPASGETAIHGLVLATDASASGPAATFVASTTTDYSAPDVDGYAGRWVVAWQATGARITTVPVRLVTGPLFSSLSVAAGTTIGGTTLSQVSAPTIGYTPGKAWLGHRTTSILVGGSTFLRATGFDSGTCVTCSDTFSRLISGTETRMAIGTMTSGGYTAGEVALAVWTQGTGVLAQRLRNHSLTGQQQNLGGQCGVGGTQSFSHATAIGSSGLVFAVNGLPAGALITVFNFSPAGVHVACGACVWNPFAGSTPMLVTGAGASIELPIPCLQSLVGTTFESQWTTIDDSQVPCSLVPGFVITDRVLHTIGS